MFCLFVLLLFYKFVLVQFILQSNVKTALNYTSSVKFYEERRGREGLRATQITPSMFGSHLAIISPVTESLIYLKTFGESYSCQSSRQLVFNVTHFKQLL